MRPPIGGRARDASWLTALTIWLSSDETTGPPLLRCGRKRPPEGVDVMAFGEP